MVWCLGQELEWCFRSQHAILHSGSLGNASSEATGAGPNIRTNAQLSA
jgi:hypothetical protein